jgi:M6 family metalloprotease-like protein
MFKNLMKMLRKNKLWPLSVALKSTKSKIVFFGSVGGLLVAVMVGVLVVSGAQQSPMPQASQSSESSKQDSSADTSESPSPSGSSSPKPSGSSSQGSSGSSTQTVLAAGTSMPSDGMEVCKIQEATGMDGYTQAGFPISPPTANSGVVKWALIPIDFPDLPGEPNFRSRVDSQMSLLTEWFSSVSGGRFKVEWVVLDRWATLPGQSGEYAIARSVNLKDAANGPKLFRDAMNAADPLFDFTGIQTVNFILPSGQTIIGEGSQGFPWDQAVKEYVSQEGPIASYSIAGQFFDDPKRTYWSYWAHEFGHAIALPHIGLSQGVTPPFNPWDLMGGQDGPSGELSGWLRFLAGWLSPEQVFCMDASKVETLEMTLVPLSSSAAGPKFAVIPITATKALMIESRRETKFSCKAPTARNGVLVYVYDATLGHGNDFLIASSPAGRQAQNFNNCAVAPNPDFLLRKGDKVVVEGFTVEVLEHGNLDKVLVSRN